MSKRRCVQYGIITCCLFGHIVDLQGEMEVFPPNQWFDNDPDDSEDSENDLTQTAIRFRKQITHRLVDSEIVLCERRSAYDPEFDENRQYDDEVDQDKNNERRDTLVYNDDLPESSDQEDFMKENWYDDNRDVPVKKEHLATILSQNSSSTILAMYDIEEPDEDVNRQRQAPNAENLTS